MCNKQFGNPSNHATFYTSLIGWMIMENIFLEAAFRFKNNLLKLGLYVSFPFILYSRIYLNYHFKYQVLLINLDCEWYSTRRSIVCFLVHDWKLDVTFRE
jgi:hypothetical protein